MKKIEPTNKEVFEYLKRFKGCTWLGGNGCECYSRIKNQGCFDAAKKRLTKKILSEEERQEEIRLNEEFNKQLDNFLTEFLSD